MADFPVLGGGESYKWPRFSLMISWLYFGPLEEHCLGRSGDAGRGCWGNALWHIPRVLACIRLVLLPNENGNSSTCYKTKKCGEKGKKAQGQLGTILGQSQMSVESHHIPYDITAKAIR